MYQSSAAFGNLIQQDSRTFRARLTLGENSITEGIKSIKINGGSNSEDDFSLGSAVSQYVEISIAASGVLFEGHEFLLEMGVVVNDSVEEYIPIGYFTAEKPDSDEEVVSFTAYDRMMKTERACFLDLPDTTTTVAVLDAISTITGVTIVTTGLAAISMQKPVGYTCREVLSYIAQMYGGFAICNREGQIEIKTYEDHNYTIGTGRYWGTFTHNDLPFVLQKITCYTGQNEDGEDISVSVGSGTRGVSFSNPFMTQAALNGIWEELEGYTYMPGSARFLGDPRIDPWDILTIEDRNGKSYKVPAMTLTQEFDGGLSTEVEAVGKSEAEQESGFQGPATKQMERYYAQLVLIDHAMVNKLDADTAKLTYATIDNLDAVKANIQDLDVSKLTARVATIEDAYIGKAQVDTLLADYATIEQLTAANGQIANLSGELSTYKTQVAGQLTAFDADITNLKAKDAELETALIGTAKITELEAVTARTQLLEADVAGINTLVNGNLTSANIQSLVLTGDKVTVEDGFIKSAMIENLSADKITGLDINTTKLTVHSEDGRSTWTDNTIQISDANRVRVQIGEDAAGDYNLYLWDAAGNLLWNATGVTESGLNDGIIKDVAVADDANISGSKLDIESVIREVNGAETTIKGTRIILDEQNQTLDAAFTSLKTYAEGVNSRTESNETAISIAQGQISTLVSNTTIVKDGQTVQLKDAFNSTVADVDSIKTTLNEHTSLIDEQSGEILAVQTQTNTIQSDLAGTKQTVSAVQSDLSGTKSRVTTVETGLDGLKNRVSATETALTKKADGTTVDTLTSRVATAEATLDGFEASLTATNKKVSANEENISKHDTRITAAENAIILKVSTTEFNSYKTTVNNEMTSAKSRLTSAESSITTMQGQIAMKVEQTDIDTAVTNIEIGGRNLFKGYDDGEIRLKDYNNTGSFTQFFNLAFDPADYVGEKFTISFYAKSPNGTTQLRLYNANNSPRYFCFSTTLDNALGTDWKYYIYTFVNVDRGSSYAVSNKVEIYAPGKMGVLVKKIKVEKGTKATDWTPAPEDVDSAITAVDNKFASYSTTTQMTAAINAAKDSITQSVSSTYATKSQVNTVSGNVTTLTSRVSAAESKLTKDSLVTTIGSYYTTASYVGTAIDGIEIGGRNLIANTGPASVTGWTASSGWTVSLVDCATAPYGKAIRTTNGTATSGGVHKPPIAKAKMVNGEKYTISAWIRASKACTLNFKNEMMGTNTISVTTSWQKYTFTSVINTGATYYSDIFYVTSGIADGMWIEVHSLKLEKGTKATDWEPAPEDMDASIASVKTIATQTSEKFNWIVKSGTSATDFTLTDRTATLVANAINLKGLVTFSGMSSAAQAALGATGLGMKVNYSSFTAANDGEAYIHGLTESGSPTDANGWVYFNGTKYTIPKTMINPNAICPYNTIIYIVRRATSATAGTTYMVWYNGGWKYAATPTPSAVGGTWTWAESTDIVLGQFVEPSSEGAFVDAYLYNPVKHASEVTIGASSYGNAATALSTANTAKTNAATAQTTADAAKTAAATAQTTANAAKSWTDANGANMVNMRNMVLKWTNNAVSTSTCIQGGWIATNTITAEKIALGDFTNYVTANESISTSVITGNNPFADNLISGGYITKKAATNQYMALTPYRVNSFDNNDELYYSFVVKGAAAGTCRIGVWFYGDGSVDDKTYKTSVLASTCSFTTSEQTFTGVIKLGSCKTYGYYAIGLQDQTSTKAQVYVKNIYIRKRSQGALIVDGTITATQIAAGAISTDKLAANAVTAAKIAAGTITATQIAANTITAAKIAAGTITATQIATKTITADRMNVTSLSAITANLGTVTAGTIQSSNYASASGNFTAAGTRILLSTGEIRSKNFAIDASGNAYFKGNLQGATGSFSGAITSTSGTIGGWTISDGCISTWRSGSKETVNIDHKEGVISLYSDGSLYAVQGNGSDDDVTVIYSGDATYTKIVNGKLEANNAKMYGDFAVRDYTGTMRRPATTAASDGTRVGWIGTRLSSSTKEFRVNGQWGTAGTTYTVLSFHAASSDIRLKENIVPTKVEALPTLNQMKLYQFDWKENHNHQSIGFVADYLEKVDSNLATGGGYDEDGNMDIKTVNEFYLMGYVVKGVQELCDWTTRLDNQVTAQNDQIARLDSQAIALDAKYQSKTASLETQLESVQYQLQQAFIKIAAQDKQIEQQEKLIKQLQAAG